MRVDVFGPKQDTARMSCLNVRDLQELNLFTRAASPWWFMIAMVANKVETRMCAVDPRFVKTGTVIVCVMPWRVAMLVLLVWVDAARYDVALHDCVCDKCVWLATLYLTHPCCGSLLHNTLCCDTIGGDIVWHGPKMDLRTYQAWMATSSVATEWGRLRHQTHRHEHWTLTLLETGSWRTRALLVSTDTMLY